MFERLAGRTPGFLSERSFRRYAVLAPYLPETRELLFEVRAQSLGRQPGEICFPGGRIEPDETPAQAAVRETVEELLVEAAQVELIAPLDVLMRPDESAVYPFLAELRGYGGSFQPGEVAEVFAVPLRFFLEHEPEIHYNTVRVTPDEPELVHAMLGVQDYPWGVTRYPVYFYRWDRHLIWGMTARFVHNLAVLCREAGIGG